jgi:hypothetical protein
VGLRLYLYAFLTISNSFDYNDLNEGTSFKALHKNWRQNPLMEDFIKWGTEFGNSLKSVFFALYLAWAWGLKKIALMCWHFRDLGDQ